MNIKTLNKVLIGVGGVLVALAVFVVGYIVYMQINYYRIEDDQSLEITNNKKETLKKG
ncbi:MAG TPA: endonuclease, partial [Terrisporobacter glycolicus]|nr:endonuclease [Terrisporobacter hibernicus]